MKPFTHILATFLLAATSARTQTSPGFPISVETNLEVKYLDTNTSVDPPGVLIPRASVLNQPTIYTPIPSSSKTYTLFLIDLDVPRNNTRVTLLHWFQPNLTPANNILALPQPTTANNISGAPYIPPTPPAGSGPHRYNFVLFAQPQNFTVPASFRGVSPPADSNARVGFDIVRFVSESGLGSPVAGNWLRVLNGSAAETSAAVAAGTATATGGSVAQPTVFEGGAVGVGGMRGVALGVVVAFVGWEFLMF